MTLKQCKNIAIIFASGCVATLSIVLTTLIINFHFQNGKSIHNFMQNTETFTNNVNVVCNSLGMEESDGNSVENIKKTLGNLQSITSKIDGNILSENNISNINNSLSNAKNIIQKIDNNLLDSKNMSKFNETVENVSKLSDTATKNGILSVLRNGAPAEEKSAPNPQDIEAAVTEHESGTCSIM